jgi:hypothetical protein
MMTPNLEPKEWPLCAWCDGAGEVDVHSIFDVDGNTQELQSTILIKCERCDATGLEPLPSEYDDPRL